MNEAVNSGKFDLSVEEEVSETEKLWNERKENWNFKKIIMLVTVILAIGLSAFHIYTAAFGTLPAWHHRSIHVIWGILLIFLFFPSGKNKNLNWFDISLILITIATAVFILNGYPAIEMRQGDPTSLDLVFGSLLILLVLEATRRTNGIFLTLIALFFLFYIFYGKYFPGALAHPGVSYENMISNMFNGTIGIFSTPIYISSTVLIVFVIFGTFLMRSGGGQAFTNISFAAVGDKVGGPALAGVGASALMGTITGNGASNAAFTGSFTIPLMKRMGYKAKFAAAVEAVASQGGQIMPPIMGASVFIMAETIGIPYSKIALYALVPAILYFLISGFVVYFHAKAQGLAGIPKEQLPKVSKVLLQQGYMFIPIILIIYLLFKGFSPMYAGFYAIITSLILSWIKKTTRMGLLSILSALEQGARNSLSVLSACAAAGIVVGAVSITGLGTTFSRFIIFLAGDNLLLLLIFVAIAAIILGMGLPTVSAYILLSILAVPALITLGVNIIAAHLFVLYFGIMSGITPPVAITSFITAGIAGSKPMETAFYSMRIGLGGFILPFIFVYNTELLLQGDSVGLTILAILTAILSSYLIAIALENYWLTNLTIIHRLMIGIASVMLIIPGVYSDGIGLLIVLVVYILQKKRIKFKNTNLVSGGI